MAVYFAGNNLGGTQQATSATYKTQLALTAATATLCRALLQEIDVGTPGTPADNYMEYDISRQTAVGTSTAITPNPNDTTFRAAGTVGSANFTAEGTITANSSVFYLGLNQRASYRWAATPGSELVIPAVNLSGLAVRSRSGAYTGLVSAMSLFIE